MIGFCIREEIEKRLPDDDGFTVALILSCCDYCKKIQNNIEIDKYNKLFIEPLWIILKNDEDTLFKAIGSYILEETAQLFKNSNDEKREFEKIVQATQKSISSGDNKYLINCLRKTSNSSYLKYMARLHSNGAYNAAFAVALCFFSAKVDLIIMAFRTQFIYKKNNEIFFDIGVSLDEGCVEYFTQKITKLSRGKYIEDAYYFEVELYKNIVKQFGLKEQEEGKVLFSNAGPKFIYEHTKNTNKCLFYDLFASSDKQNWRRTYQILKEIKEETNNGVDL